MSFKQGRLVETIIENLAYVSRSTLTKNSISLFDDNRKSQDFYCNLFKLIFGYEDLRDLDLSHSIGNYPSIDLATKKYKIAFQVTSDNTSTKIKETISKFLERKFYGTYTRLVFIFIGTKKKYTSSFYTKGKFMFDLDKDIWDDDFIANKIRNIQDIKKLEEIENFLIDHLLEYKFPDTLIENDINKSIDILVRDFGEKEISIINGVIDREGDYIKDVKNPLNNISWDVFKGKIKGHIKYNETINSFLSNPLNKKSTERYFQVCSKINCHYEDNKESYSSFDEVMRFVFNSLDTYNNDGINVIKIKILIHNMYFNCDIGINKE